MPQPTADITVRPARDTDTVFIRSLSPALAAGAKLDWHTDAAVQAFQDAYINEMIAETSVPHITLIAEMGGTPTGFIHAREHRDDISGEACGTVPLLAVTASAQGNGIGKLLMEAAENWAKAQGYRLLHLEVFSTNNQARRFYDTLGFKPDTINMIKSLD